MKRKITIEEYNDWPSADVPRSRIDRVLDYFCGAPEVYDFYPRSRKRSYFPDSRTFRTVSFSNGILFGGCMMEGCVNSCIPLKDFCPSSREDARAFTANLQVHDTAVSNRDLEMATEYRAILESSRSDVCRHCKSRVQPSPQPEPQPPDASTTDDGDTTHSTPNDTNAVANSADADGSQPGAEDVAEANSDNHSDDEEEEEEEDDDEEEGGEEEGGEEEGGEKQTSEKPQKTRPSMPRPSKRQ